jgi:hypothetical protein
MIQRGVFGSSPIFCRSLRTWTVTVAGSCHPGISGIADLDPTVQGWSGAVIMVEIVLVP